jgi:spore germination cell wall hydrolase CwlJ-like protein
MNDMLAKIVITLILTSVVFTAIASGYLIHEINKTDVKVDTEDLADKMGKAISFKPIMLHQEVEKRVAPELMEYTSDYDLLVKIVYLEARGEPFEGKVMVAATVLNRVLDENFPNTIREVILQEGQFQPAKYLDTVEVEEEYLEEIELAIYEAMAEEYEGLYFVNPEIADKDSYEWMKNNLEFVYEVDNHEFYK